MRYKMYYFIWGKCVYVQSNTFLIVYKSKYKIDLHAYIRSSGATATTTTTDAVTSNKSTSAVVVLNK